MAIYSEFSPLKIVIFHNYVSLPEGKGFFLNFDGGSSLKNWQLAKITMSFS